MSPSKLQGSRAAWLALGAAMCASAAWLLLSGRNTTFSGDDLYYYARYVAQGFGVEPGGGLEYFFAPHNGHFQLVGKAVYRLLFTTVGADYLAFRVVDVAAVLLTVGLFFELARRRVGPLVALAPSVLLLFLGYAWEPLLWAFDMHTVLSVAFGLAALLALERGDRGGDRAACALLLFSVATIEVGLAFVVGVAVSVLLAPDRWRRAWIFLVPVVLYAIWWAWARQFDQSDIALLNVRLIPVDLPNALAAVIGSIFGLNPTGADITPQVTTVTSWGTALAVVALVALAVRIRRGDVPGTLWVFLAIVVAYWITIALGDRPPDSSRYILLGTVMVLLIAVDAARGIEFSRAAVLAIFALVALAIPANIAKFYDGRRAQLTDASASRSEYAMLELAERRVDPGYTPGTDPVVTAAGGSVFTSLPAVDYLRASREFGSLAFSLEEVRSEDLLFRQVADATLVGALRIELQPAAAPSDPGRCPSMTGGTLQESIFFQLPPGGARLGSRSGWPIDVGISRFAKDGPGIELGQLPPSGWARLEVPADSAPDRWQLLVNGSLYVCGAR